MHIPKETKNEIKKKKMRIFLPVSDVDVEHTLFILIFACTYFHAFAQKNQFAREK